MTRPLDLLLEACTPFMARVARGQSRKGKLVLGNLDSGLVSPLYIGKQLKFLLAALHTRTLEHMCRAIRDSLWEQHNKTLLWAPSLLGLLTMSMVIETMQVAIRCKEALDKREGIILLHDDSANLEVSNMDEKLNGLIEMFRKKYGVPRNEERNPSASFNPIRDLDDRELLDGPGQRLAKSINKIVSSHRKQSPFYEMNILLKPASDHFLEDQKTLDPPTTHTEPRYSRLVALFLLSFYRSPPQRPGLNERERERERDKESTNEKQENAHNVDYPIRRPCWLCKLLAEPSVLCERHRRHMIFGLLLKKYSSLARNPANSSHIQVAFRFCALRPDGINNRCRSQSALHLNAPPKMTLWIHQAV